MTSSVASFPDAVLAAFGVAEAPVILAGGKGGTWRAGRLALKPVEFLAETLWRAEVLAQLPDSTEFRVARPVRALDGSWVAHGWEASQLVAGDPDVSRQDDVLRTGIAFHTAIADQPRPAFLDLRDDPWSIGDRVAWDELPVQACPVALDLLEPLINARRPVDNLAAALWCTTSVRLHSKASSPAHRLPPSATEWRWSGDDDDWATCVAGQPHWH